MRSTSLLLVALAAVCGPSVASAQIKEKFKHPEIKRIHIGFQTFSEDERTTYKVGLWTPITIELFGGTEGIKTRPNEDPPFLEIETPDSEDVGTKIRVRVDVDAEKSRTYVGYIKTGHVGRNFSEGKITLHANGRKYEPRAQDLSNSLEIDRHLYLVIGAKMLELNRAIKQINRVAAVEDKEFPGDRFDPSPRQLVFETNADHLPEMWFGYQGVDLLILATEENAPFLNALHASPERVKAIAQWVRRGGRLIVPISPARQDIVASILSSEAWQPPIPVKPPRAGEDLRFERVPGLAAWGGQPLLSVGGMIPVATLNPGNVAAGDWRVLLESSDARDAKPMVTQVRYGLGTITYLAFSMDDKHFLKWEGRQRFWEALIQKTAPKAPAEQAKQEFRGQRQFVPDVSTDLLRQLDEFDVTVIPFGYVALFIVLYILVVGPLDFVLLKYVFKRLEWTWITFPSVVLGVSVMAYFAAYALKGRDLKINKIDIVDIDQRTHLDRQSRQPLSAHAIGHSFFTILSPRIQSYTVGIEPNPLFWGAEPRKVKRGEKEASEVLSADLLSWMGRPSGGMHDMGRRGGSGGFFRNAYKYKDDASALEEVPIPVWTTKSFTASWERKLDKPPIVANLAYHTKLVQGKEVRITGKIENHLGVDLVDLWMLYNDKIYPIEGEFKSVKHGGAALTLAISPHDALVEIGKWGRMDAEDPNRPARAWSQDPTGLVKQILFTELLDPGGSIRNHLLRPLDQSSRVHERGVDQGTRDAVLFARVKYTTGRADELMRDAAAPPATKLWLGDTPETGKSAPSVPGNMNQDTYIRVFLGLRPGDD